ncbi:MAG: outer membrane beta-barrel protein [Pseudomonadota bacterium]|nr:outer membrane beta-barrel protein [Pseudomonadota bacterium]
MFKAALALAMVLVSGVTWASEGESTRRPYSTEFSFNLNYLESDTFDGPNGSYLDMSDDVGLGFAYLYNYNAHWAFGGSINWATPNYKAFVKAEAGAEDFTYKNELEMFTLNFDMVYYFLQRPFTPFVTGTLGWANIDTNIASGGSYDYCWWDYWGGYYCTSYRPTKSESGLNYGVGLGLRWDFNRDWALKGTYRWSEVDIDVAGENPTFTSWRLEFARKLY